MERRLNTEPSDNLLNLDYDSIYHSQPQRLSLQDEAQFNELHITPSDDELNRSEVEPCSLEHFTEYLKCFICFRRVKEPVMCPACSKFACEGCLKQWIIEEKSECPFCRSGLSLSQLVKCRFVKDFSRVIDSLKMQQVRNYSLYEKNETIDKCQEHGLKMIYFCATCDEVICPDCVMFTKNHSNHDIERLKNIYERKVDLINNEMNDLKRKIGKYEKYLAELSSKADQLKDAKEKRMKDLLLLSRALNAKLESDLASRLHSLVDERRKIEDELEYFESIYSEMSSKLKSSTPAKTINSSEEYLKQLNEANKREFKSSIPKNMISDFENDTGIQYATGVFVLKRFSVKKESNEIVYSDPLIVDGITWRLKVYPNGTGKYKTEYLSLFVEMVKGWDNGGAYCYKVTLVKPHREADNIEREYISEFENSICWGYNRFCKLDDIETQGFWNSESDEIVLRYQIKPANHLQKIKDQANYVKSLEDQIRVEQDTIKQFMKERRNSRIIETVSWKKERLQLKAERAAKMEETLEISPIKSERESLKNEKNDGQEDAGSIEEGEMTAQHNEDEIDDKEDELMIREEPEELGVICEVKPTVVDEQKSENLIDDQEADLNLSSNQEEDDVRNDADNI